MDPASTAAGRVDLDLAIEASAPTAAQLLAHANGHLYIATWPEGFDATLVDMWAANLFSALVSAAKKKPSSTVNCLACAFILEDGVLSEKAMIVDTTHVRIAGDAHVDFRNERFSLRLAPRPKKPTFFSLSVPVGAKGSFKEPKLAVSALDVMRGVARSLFSIVTVPVLSLFVEAMPPDGSEDCTAVMKGFLAEGRE
jgi:hypothetical protein